MDEAATVLMTVEIAAERPGVGQAAAALGVQAEALDKAFGVVAVDPERHLYAVQVRASALEKRPAEEEPFRGPFSNPKIAPFGPPR